MKHTLTILFIFFISITESQNLVPNGGFEDTVHCGAEWYPITNAVEWDGFWSPDYFNSCVVPNTSSWITDVPTNTLGFQYPKKGNAYVGLITHEYNDVREYIYCKLSQQLQANRNYCVSFNIVLAQNSAWATNRIGAYFSSDTLDPEPLVTLTTPPWWIFTHYIPQIEDTTMITDTLEWTKISGSFQAIGNEKFITIGNFRDDNDTDTLRVAFHSWGTYSYYYLDEVSVEEVLPADAGSDANFIVGDSVQLGNNPTENATYVWSPITGLSDPNAANPKASPLATTAYIVTKTQCSVTTRDTVTITTPLGINENESFRKIKLYPNPNNGIMTLECNLQEHEKGELIIYALTGTIVKRIQLNGIKTFEIDITNLQSGMYLYEVRLNDKAGKRNKLSIIK